MDAEVAGHLVLISFFLPNLSCIGKEREKGKGTVHFSPVSQFLYLCSPCQHERSDIVAVSKGSIVAARRLNIVS